jgi:ribosomal-protein-alanine N-acetyltransferase
VRIIGRQCVLRPWRKGDEASLVRNADNRRVWMNLMDIFTHPYTMKDARDWLEMRRTAKVKGTVFAIEVDWKPVGGIGLDLHKGNFAGTADIGYWLGEPYWGRGIVTEAVKLMTRYAFRKFNLERIEAGVFAWNPASARVLEKAGFRFEGRMKKRISKDGKKTDELMYAKLGAK